MENVDLLIFAGQSNMRGETEGLPSLNNPISNAFEYKFLSDSFISLQHPVGEDIGDGILSGATNGCGTLVPDFCDEYAKSTSKKVVAVHTTRGATTISQWLKGTDRYNCMIKKINSSLKKTKENHKIDKVYFVWLQGESDAVGGTTQDHYKEMLIDFKNALKGDLGIDIFCIIQVGYFCGIVPWSPLSTDGQGIYHDEEIMMAQQSVVQKDGDFIMLTDICKKISLDSEYINSNVPGHFNNKGMSLIGRVAGRQLALYEKKSVST